MTTISNLPTLTTITNNTQVLIVAEDQQVIPSVTKKVSLTTLFAEAINGIVGAQGVHGAQGIQGPSGPNSGIQGSTGQSIQGSQGFQGTQGLQGLQGVQGVQGRFGPQGVQGKAGAQGTQGFGSQGVQGTAGTVQGTQGTQGQSIQGTSGSIIARSTASGSSSSISNGATSNFSITGYKSYSLLKLSTNAAAWVRLYTTSAARTADSSRVQSIDPIPGTGVIVDVVTTSTSTVPYTQPITPGLIGFNDDSSPNTNIYAAVTNLSGSTQAITVTLTLLQLEL